MSFRLARLGACILLVLGSAKVLPAQNCDRACLGSMLDRYLNAVVRHDPSAAPLFGAFRQTENAVVVRAPGGVWQTVKSLGKIQRRYFDPVTGQAGYFGTLEEDGGAAVATLRLRVERRMITEAEWVIARRSDTGINGQPATLFNADTLVTVPPPAGPLATAARTSREVLLAVTNSYFDGLTTHDGAIIIAHPGCLRVENGVVTAGRGGAQAAPGRGAAPAGRGGATSDCTSNLANFNVSLVAARRYPLVDEEAGVVLGIVIFIRKPGTTSRRNLLTEWFYIEEGKIRNIYASMFFPANDLPLPNWPPYEGNWPLPAELAPPAARKP